jgi:hypothetical protein
MKRRTLDMIFVVGGVLLAVLLGVLGLVLRSNANFAKSYVKDQLTEQQITFPAAATLVKAEAWKADVVKSFGGDQAAADKFIADNELTAEAETACLVDNAGKALATGKQAECYANKYIRLHLKDGSIFEGKSYTYASIGGVQRELRTAVADAKAKGDDAAQKAAQGRLDTVNSMRDTLFRGETLRGLLLTSYGFSIFGEKAATASTVALLAGLVLLLASIAGLVHALMTPKERVVHLGHPEAATV